MLRVEGISSDWCSKKNGLQTLNGLIASSTKRCLSSSRLPLREHVRDRQNLITTVTTDEAGETEMGRRFAISTAHVENKAAAWNWVSKKSHLSDPWNSGGGGYDKNQASGKHKQFIAIIEKRMAFEQLAQFHRHVVKYFTKFVFLESNSLKFDCNSCSIKYEDQFMQKVKKTFQRVFLQRSSREPAKLMQIFHLWHNVLRKRLQWTEIEEETNQNNGEW